MGSPSPISERQAKLRLELPTEIGLAVDRTEVARVDRQRGSVWLGMIQDVARIHAELQRL